MKFIAVFLFTLFLASRADAATYYVGVGGTGINCTQYQNTATRSPTVQAGVNCATIAGDVVVIGNGTYVGSVLSAAAGTSGSKIIIKGENPGQARIMPTVGATAYTVSVRHDHVHLQDFVIDDNRQTMRSLWIYNGGSGLIDGAIVEGLTILNSGGVGVKFQGVAGCSLRWNYINSTGWGDNGEAFYVGTNSGTPTNSSCEIWSTSTNDTIDNFVDFKPGTTGFNFHHNVFANHEMGFPRIGENRSQRCVTSSGSNSASGNRFDSNIIEDCDLDVMTTAIIVLNSNRVDFDSNIWHTVTENGGSPDAGFTGNWGGGSYTNNVHRNTPSSNTSTNSTFSGNSFNVSQATYDAAKAVLLAEITAQANNPKLRWTGPTIVSAATVDSTHIDLTFANDYFPPIKSPDHTKCTATEDAAGRAVSAGEVIGTNVLRLTVATLSGGTTLLATCTAGAVSDSNNFLAITGFTGTNTPSVAFTNQAVTNNIGGAPPAYVLTQSHFRCYGVPFLAGALDPRSTVDARCRMIKSGSVIAMLQVNCTVANCPTFAGKFQGSWNETDWFNVSVAHPTAFDSNNMRFSGTTQYSNAAQYPQQLYPVSGCLDATGLTPVTGAVERTGAAVPNYTLSQDECVNFAAMIDVDSDVTPGSILYLRIVDQGSSPAFLVLQDGTSMVLLQNGSDRLLLQEGVATGVFGGTYVHGEIEITEYNAGIVF